MPRSSTPKLIALALITIMRGGPVRAADTPASFVPLDMCTTKPCTCADIPMMERFLANQVNARDVWKGVEKDLLSGTGPRSLADAAALFNSRFMGDPAVVSQFQSCPSFDPAKNHLDKVAGITGFGSAVLDPCFCSAFCRDIILATVAHERRHPPTIILGVVAYRDYMVGCKVGILSGAICDIIEPLIIAQSEVSSYGAGIDSLQAALNELKAHDPANTDVACTWKAIVRERPTPPLVPPDGFLERLELLLGRIAHGGGR